MNTKYQIKFLLEKRRDKKTGNLIEVNVPINMDVTFLRQRFRYYSGYRIDNSKWDATAQKVTQNASNAFNVNAATINKHLANLKVLAEKHMDYNNAVEIIPSSQSLRKAIEEGINKHKSVSKSQFFEKYDEYIEKARVSPGRRALMISTKNHLQRFEKKLGRNLAFGTLNEDVIRAFEQYLKEDAIDPETYKDIKSNRKPRLKGQNTISGIIKRVSSFILWAEKESLVKTNPIKNYVGVAEVYSTPIILTKDERDKLNNADLPNDRLKRVRDIFLFQCNVGCRVGDLVKLTHANVIGGDVLQYIPRKTKDERPVVARVPLNETAKAILMKYNLPKGQILPFITDQRYNEYLKELFEVVGLNRMITRLNTRTHEEEQLPLYSIATSHIARKTFIGILHKAGVKNEVIASMSGHVTDSRAFSRYYDVDDEQRQQAIRECL